MEITLRIAELRDSKLIAEMLYKLVIDIGDTDVYRGSQEAIAQYGFGPEKRFHCAIAEADETAVGFTIYFPTFSTTRGEPGVYLQDLWVDKPAREKGVANKLLQYVSRASSEQWNATNMTLSVYNDNIKAVKYYQSMGFKIGERERYAALDGASFQGLVGRC